MAILKTNYPCSDKKNIDHMTQKASKDLDDYILNFHENNNTVEFELNGETFITDRLFDDQIDDAIIIDLMKHKDLLIHDLTFPGVLYHIYDMEKSHNRISIPLGSSQTTMDYITWLIMPGDHVSVEMVVHQVMIKSRKITYSGARHKKLLKKLRKNRAVDIIDEGIMDAALLAQYRHEFSKLNSPIPINVNQFGPITIRVNIGNPETVGDLVKYVRKFKRNLYKRIK